MRMTRFAALIGGAALLSGLGAAQAQSYRPGAWLNLDLKKALLSPTPLGPAASFQPVLVEAKADAKNEIDAAADAPRPAVQQAAPVVRQAAPVARPRAVATRPQPPARTRVARPRPRSNPLDANAADTRIQTWPCRSGGICNWQK